MRRNHSPHGTRMGFLPLVAATFFMVSGGPYAIEDIFGGAGFERAILILVMVPLLWSLPTALMIGELATAIPAEGGFYVWVRRAMGPFWGFQEAWLSLAASIFDMAIYPAFAVDYLGKLNPALTGGWHGYAWSLAVVAICCLWNLRGAVAVGDGSLGLSILLLSPFLILVVLGFWRGMRLHPAVQWSGPSSGAALSTAILVAMWNYMGWDNASTIAGEVRHPQSTYAKALLSCIAIVVIAYVLPVAAMAIGGLSANSFATGDWSSAAAQIGGSWLGWAVAAGGALTGVGMFNALVLSYSRLPMAMAQDGMLPAGLARTNRYGVPWMSVLACSLAWGLALNLSFEKLITVDMVLYGGSLLLEFAALVILRVREPGLERPFRVGGLALALSLGIGPAALIAYALYISRSDALDLAGHRISALLFSLVIAALGPLLYWAARRAGVRRPSAACSR